MSSDRDERYWNGRAQERGAAAAGYADPVLEAQELALRRAAFERICPLKPGLRALDAGCGSGRWSVALAKAGCTVVGIDLSAAMIALAPSADGVRYLTGSVADLAEPDGAFDLILSVTALQHITEVSELRRALANIARMLAPGGRFFMLEYSPPKPLARLRSPSYMRYRTYPEWLVLLAEAGLVAKSSTAVRHLWPLYGLIQLVSSGDGVTSVGSTGRFKAAGYRAALRLEAVLAAISPLRRISDERATIFVAENPA